MKRVFVTCQSYCSKHRILLLSGMLSGRQNHSDSAGLIKIVGIPVMRTITAMTACNMSFPGRESLSFFTPSSQAILSFFSEKIIDMGSMVINIKRKEQK